MACRAGASGCAVGRAVWQEAVALAGAARLAFLKEVALARLETLAKSMFRPRPAMDGFLLGGSDHAGLV